MSFMIGILLFFGCENDINEVNKIENIQKEEAVDISKDVKVIYSDSAIVKAQMTGPEMRIYHDTTQNKNSNYEFQKGIQIIFYDKNGIESQRIKSDYGLQRAKEQIIEFKKNVVITMANGSIIRTEEFFYDQANKRYYNSVPITFEMKDGRGNFQGTSFTSDDSFNNIKAENMNGFYVPSSTSMFPSFGN
ncbi:LPS export ABC transporter periplasmic protein LptC [Sphingobacterium rhinopitheci]|uniref:LPS export ABC transporter periplasmic protein LptC n=1 Tax=Sphingobacterium rhinopitheci TaxID=2781960 RepID=UPI001F524688|nr:LPS export ABC transporter periplasmic protein LptC [Sphingobacterium rhinopitheci]